MSFVNNGFDPSMDGEIKTAPVKLELKPLHETKEDEEAPQAKSSRFLYGLEDSPSWYLGLLLGFQHFLLMYGAMVAVPIMLAPAMCIPRDSPARGHLISTTTFTCGLATFLQTTFGCRLPIVQGSSYSLLVPALIVLKQPQWKCPPETHNATMSANTTESDIPQLDPDETWQIRMRELQGAVCVAAVFQLIIGATGLIGRLLPYITPLTVAPVVALIGLAIIDEIMRLCSLHWGISLATIGILTLFSQYLDRVNLPLPAYSKLKGCHVIKYPFFMVFSILLGVLSVWGLSAILTATDVFPEDSPARTDTNLRAVADSQWFRFPYPGQWGMPTVGIGPVLGVLTGLTATVFESIGTYYLCASTCEVDPPPVSTVNRGIFFEGICCILCGLWGTGNGVTSYSTNFAIMTITKVASRRVMQYCALCMVVFSVIPKFGALFVIIPDPVMGGLFFIVCALVVSMGISFLKDVEIDSPRNIFIIGISLMGGLVVPAWVAKNPNAINTGNTTANQMLSVLLSTSMFIGGFLGFAFDNTIPGSLKERGLVEWRAHLRKKNTGSIHYDLPFGMNFIRRISLFKHCPISPTYEQQDWSCRRKKDTTISSSHL